VIIIDDVTVLGFLKSRSPRSGSLSLDESEQLVTICCPVIVIVDFGQIFKFIPGDRVDSTTMFDF
jgi:hypothetical protein